MAYLITEDCVFCGTCWEICPTRSIIEYEWYYRISDTCAECGACARVCPNTAIIRIENQKKLLIITQRDLDSEDRVVAESDKKW